MRDYRVEAERNGLRYAVYIEAHHEHDARETARELCDGLDVVAVTEVMPALEADHEH